jgi:hypothetical protein
MAQVTIASNCPSGLIVGTDDGNNPVVLAGAPRATLNSGVNPGFGLTQIDETFWNTWSAGRGAFAASYPGARGWWMTPASSTSSPVSNGAPRRSVVTGSITAPTGTTTFATRRPARWSPAPTTPSKSGAGSPLSTREGPVAYDHLRLTASDL